MNTNSKTYLHTYIYTNIQRYYRNIVQVAFQVMATVKRLAYPQTLPIIEDYASSITIQLPTTSANQQHNDNNNNITDNFVPLDNNNNINRGISNNDSFLNYCHNQAATRSLLLARENTSIEQNTNNTSTESDDTPTPPPHYHEIPGIVPSYQGRTSGPPPSYDDVVNPNAPPPSYQSLFGQVREARKTSNGLVDLFRQLFLVLIGTLGCTMIIGFLLLIPITMILVGIVYINECRAENIPAFLVIGGFVWIVKNILNCYNQFKKDSSTANRPPPRRTPISSTAPNHRTTNSNSINSTPNVLIVSQTTVNDNNNILTIQSHNHSVHRTTNESSSATRTLRVNSRDHHQAINRIRHPSLIGITSFKCETMLNYFLIVWFLVGCIVVYRIYEPDYENPLSTAYCNRTVYLYAFWLMTSAFIIMAIILSCLCCLMASSLMSCNHGRC